MVAVTRFFTVLGITALTGLAGFAGYRFVRADIAAKVYRDRLADMARDYETLRATYNEAVKRTAVTELVVKDKKLSVRIRAADGTDKEIPTTLDPSGEVYVDFVVLDQRLWIRRVFDDKTPPWKAVVIDPGIEEIDWDDPSAAHGKAVYRRLTEGRWVVSVSGDGALGLARAEERPALTSKPVIKDYKSAEVEAMAEADRIGVGDVWEWVTGK